METIPLRQIRALHDAETIRVYQAYSDDIADAALAQGKFVSPPFKMEQMTRIKPSFLWMMYRAGWGQKGPGQKRVLALDISRAGFEWALGNACLSHPDPGQNELGWREALRRSPVRIQWDPERDLQLQPQQHRAIQIGLSGEAVERYVNEWIVRLTDITPVAHRIHELVSRHELEAVRAELPVERPYSVTAAIGARIGMIA